MKIDPKYTATVTSTGGREGHAVSDDGILDVQLRRPKLQGAPEGTNPEQLFAAAWAACYQGALIATTRGTDIDVSDSKVTVHVSMGPVEDGTGYGLSGKIEVSIPGLPQDKVQELANAADALCPYSRAVRGNIEVAVLGVE